jgi:hypothetical protein
MKNCCAIGGQLKGVAVSAGVQHQTSGALLAGDCCGEKIVGLVAWRLGDREAAGGDEVRKNRQLLDEVGIEVATTLVWPK